MILDVVFLAINIYYSIKGSIRGALLEIFSLLGLLITTFLAKRYTQALYINVLKVIKSKKIGIRIDNNYYIYIICYASLFIISYLVLYFIIILLKKLIKSVMLNWLDSVLGFLAGFIKGILINSILFSSIIFIGFYEKKIDTYIKNSYSYKVLPTTSKYIYSLIPAPLVEKLISFKKVDNLFKKFKNRKD